LSCILVDVKRFSNGEQALPKTWSRAAGRSETALLAVLKTADCIRGELNRVLHPNAITLQQYDILRILSQAGERGVPTLSIAEHMTERSPGITRLLDRMEQRTWIWRRRCLQDRRVVYVGVAPAGIALVAHLQPALHRCLARFADALHPTQQAGLEHALSVIRSQLEE
jgi:DNA-binding MarR family transcriptional regulator